MHDGRLELARTSRAAAVVFAVVILTGAPSAGQQVATQSVSATVSFAPRTALTVSTRTLHFVVTDALTPATASVEFSAAARTLADGSVALMADAAGMRRTAFRCFARDCFRTGRHRPRSLSSQQPVVAGRWTGSGVRSGRITFQLRAQPGSYDIPLRFSCRSPDRAERSRLFSRDPRLLTDRLRHCDRSALCLDARREAADAHAIRGVRVAGCWLDDIGRKSRRRQFSGHFLARNGSSNAAICSANARSLSRADDRG